MFKEVIGKRSKKVKNTVERGMVRKFTEAIGDSQPIFVDEAYGKKSRYGQNIAPPTFPIILDYGEIEELHLPNVGLIHGEQTYHYTRPLLVGEEIYCDIEVADYYEKDGGHGLMGFIILQRNGEDLEGNHIYTEKQVIIITEAVRKELTR